MCAIVKLKPALEEFLIKKSVGFWAERSRLISEWDGVQEGLLNTVRLDKGSRDLLRFFGSLPCEAI